MLPNKKEKFLHVFKISRVFAIKLGIRESNTKGKRLMYFKVLLYSVNEYIHLSAKLTQTLEVF